MLRQRDLLAVEERLELDRGARVAELLDEGYLFFKEIDAKVG